MPYRKQKNAPGRERRFRKGKIKRFARKSFLGIVLLAMMVAGVGQSLPENWPIHSWVGGMQRRLSYLSWQRDTIPDRTVGGALTVDFIDVGQGNAVLVMQGGHAMLFDCGPEEKGTFLQNYLFLQGVDQLDYVIGSHPDADHIGGMDVVLTKFHCENVFMPDLERDTVSYRNVMDAADYRGYEVVSPVPGTNYDIGDAQFTVLGPLRKDAEEVNNHSIVIRLKYGSVSFLFTGDAQWEEEKDLLESDGYLESDVYLAGHHGSSNASSEEFLQAVRPQYAVISCGEGNDYGHPHQRVLESLKNRNIKLFRTDRQGTIRAVSDGASLSWNVSPTE